MPVAKPAYTAAFARSQLAKVRRFCLALPDVTERPSHGAPTFFAKNKRSFANFVDNHHGDGRLAVIVAAAPGAQEMLVDAKPDIYYLPAYVARLGWVGVRLDRDAAWTEIEAMLEAAHTHVATKKR